MNIDNVFIVYKNDLGRVEVKEERIYVDMLTKDHFFEILHYISVSLLNQLPLLVKFQRYYSSIPAKHLYYIGWLTTKDG